jgi:hypothetical protein
MKHAYFFNPKRGVILLIKNKIIFGVVLFLMKITRTLRVNSIKWYSKEQISYTQTKTILDFASAINRISIRLLRFTKAPSLKKGG